MSNSSTQRTDRQMYVDLLGSLSAHLPVGLPAHTSFLVAEIALSLRDGVPEALIRRAFDRVIEVKVRRGLRDAPTWDELYQDAKEILAERGISLDGSEPGTSAGASSSRSTVPYTTFPEFLGQLVSVMEEQAQQPDAIRAMLVRCQELGFEPQSTYRIACLARKLEGRTLPPYEAVAP